MLQSMQGVRRQAGRGLRLLVVGIACALLAPAAGAAPAGNGKVAFVDSGHVWLVEPDGTGLTQTDLAGVNAVLWSPDGERLAYTTVASGSYLLVPHVANADGSSPQQLVDEPSSSYAIACWLTADELVLNSTDALWVVGADGTGLRRRTTEPGPYTTTGQACAGDGSKVAYSVGTTPAAFWIPAAGGAPVRISSGDLLAGPPSLSPDGRYALVFRFEPGGSSAIQRVDLATGSVVPLGRALGIIFGFWSPDGRSVANTTFEVLGGRFPLTGSSIYVRAADGSGEHDLSAMPARLLPQDGLV